ncbi:MAG: hypothetical protein ABIJ34_00345 [archaeon]
MDTPQEVEVWFVLPALRREFVISMKKMGQKQNEIASLLGITEASVSQYLKGKRGNDVAFAENLIEHIHDSCKELIHKKTNFAIELQKSLRFVKKSKFICAVCNDKIKTSDDCEICYR